MRVTKRTVFGLTVFTILLLLTACSYRLAEWRVARLYKVYEMRLVVQTVAMAKMLSVGTLQDLQANGIMPSTESQRVLSENFETFSRASDGWSQYWVLFPTNGGFQLGPSTSKLAYPQAPRGQILTDPAPELLACVTNKTPISYTAVRKFTNKPDELVQVTLAPVYHPTQESVRYVIGRNSKAHASRAYFHYVRTQTYLLALPLALALIGGFWLILYRDAAGRISQWLRYGEVIIIVAAVLSILPIFTITLRESELISYSTAFLQQVDYFAHRLTMRMSDSENQILADAVNLPRLTPKMTDDVFKAFTAPYQKQNVFPAIGWVDRVPGKDRQAYEAAKRADGHTNYSIWEWDAGGERIPSPAREIHYPVAYAASGVGGMIPDALGFDRASDFYQLDALDHAHRFRRTTVSPPVLLVMQPGAKGLMVIQPVFTPETGNLFGLLTMPVRLDYTLRGYSGMRTEGHEMISLELFRLNSEGGATFLDSSNGASARRIAETPKFPLCFTSPETTACQLPLLLFDSPFTICIYPGAYFHALHPFTAHKIALFTLLLILPLVVSVVYLIRRSQQGLEALVADCTQELNLQSDRLLNVTGNVAAVLWELDLHEPYTYTYLSNYSDNHGVIKVGGTFEQFCSRVHPDDLERFTAEVKEHVKTGITFTHEYRLIDPAGKIHWLHEHMKFIAEGGTATRAIGITNDVTAQKESELEKFEMDSALRKAQRLEAVGLLAGGVAHDFNNMLQVILGNTELVLSDLDPANRNYAAIAAVQATAQKATSVTRQLLAFARKQTVAPIAQNLCEAIQENIQILERLAGPRITIKFEPCSGPRCVIKIDPSQLNQILVNLVMNARDAILERQEKGAATEPGLITISVSRATMAEATWNVGFAPPPGEYARVTILDNGCGMTADVADKMFEPFFTTREQGAGRGLGLSSVHGALTQNKGGVNVQSLPNSGTMVIFYLPIYDGEPEEIKPGERPALQTTATSSAPVAPAAPKPKAPVKKDATIMVVEDDPGVLRLAEASLISLGYQVIAVNHSPDVVSMLSKKDLKVDLLLSDMIMPEMNGAEVHQIAKRIRPSLPVVFMSGYTADILNNTHAELSKVKLLHKPFTRDALGTFVAEALDAANTPT